MQRMQVEIIDILTMHRMSLLHAVNISSKLVPNDFLLYLSLLDHCLEFLQRHSTILSTIVG